ncbi:MAG: response regulator [Desulfobacteraceae bacterium]|jgi:signal transduction histidine kinase
MNEIDVLKWQLERYRAVLSQQIERLYNVLEELQRTTLLLTVSCDITDEKIDAWLRQEGFAIDEDGFYQSIPLVSAFRNGKASEDAVSISWSKNLVSDPHIRRHMYCHRNIGSHLKHIHDRLGDIGWIYYQDAANASLQYPYIDQGSAIPFDFDWTSYYTFISVNPENNPERQIRWTPPTVDYAGEGIILSVSIPVWRGETFLGLWSIDLPIRYLYRDFSSLTPFPNQSRFIVDQQGLLVLHDKLQAEIDQKQGSIFLHPITELGGDWESLNMKSVTKTETGVQFIMDENSKEWIFCHCQVPGVNWTLFSGLPKAEMEDAAARRLRQAFQHISDGNFSHRIEVTESNAMSTLIEEFNRMTTRLSLAEEHREDIEKQLRQAQKMEAVGRLAGGVAHDYNNMISIIMGYTELALEGLEKDNPLYADLQQVLEAATRSKELTRQLLAFARQQSIDPKTLDLNDTVESMLRMLHPLIGEDIDLIWHPGEDICPIYIDPSQIDQILANLCVNSRDAINGVGKIIIETALTELDDEYCAMHGDFTPGHYVRLSVTDDGKGMDSVTLNNIFEPFFSTKSIGKGTGLGLATVYGIVKQNNGFINVYSEPGHGATFKIYFPMVTDRSVETLPQNLKATPSYENETILLVEDDASILMVTKRMLKKLGYRVLTANSPMETITLVENNTEAIDLLITDVIMPELNGRDLSEKLRVIYPGLKVLFMSGYTSNVIVHRGVLDKDVFLLQKPFSKKELAAKVREVLAEG